jgi:hypothetical protein
MELPVTASPTWPWLIFALALLVFHLLFMALRDLVWVGGRL